MARRPFPTGRAATGRSPGPPSGRSRAPAIPERRAARRPRRRPARLRDQVKTRDEERLALAYAHNLARIGVDGERAPRRRGPVPAPPRPLRFRHDAGDLDGLALARQRAARPLEFGRRRRRRRLQHRRRRRARDRRDDRGDPGRQERRRTSSPPCARSTGCSSPASTSRRSSMRRKSGSPIRPSSAGRRRRRSSASISRHGGEGAVTAGGGRRSGRLKSGAESTFSILCGRISGRHALRDGPASPRTGRRPWRPWGLRKPGAESTFSVLWPGKARRERLAACETQHRFEVGWRQDLAVSIAPGRFGAYAASCATMPSAIASRSASCQGRSVRSYGKYWAKIRGCVSPAVRATDRSGFA